ncbi:magnesium transporter CorA family protein [Falsibacillus albus]|uniref:Magnesium transporter CorA n=1 Tax=Falsibacillus albus TaxID=2478915 RepID=A0A3L7JSR0_9BACI|nr:magnesium transporter CorA family protein [Falsibacillus albus]RLQ93364.1 magnesium transporter CorA [Falsibacillus albus]
MLIYSSENEQVREVDQMALPALEGNIVWIHFNPDKKHDFHTLLHELKIHPLAKKGLEEFSEIPKVDVFKHEAVVSLFAIKEDYTEAKLSILVGENYVITKEEQSIELLEQLKSDFLVHPEYMSHTGQILFQIFTKVTMGDLKMIDRIADQIQEIERNVFDRPFDNRIARKVYRWKTRLHRLRNGIEAQGNVMETMSRSDFPFINEEAGFYFQTLNNNYTRVVNALDSFKENLNSIFNLQMTLKADHSNAIMKTLTLFSVIFIPMTFIAGLNGMNFTIMPELKWKYGYLFALILMFSVGMAIALYFKSKGWWGEQENTKMKDPR